MKMEDSGGRAQEEKGRRQKAGLTLEPLAPERAARHRFTPKARAGPLRRESGEERVPFRKETTRNQSGNKIVFSQKMMK